MCPDIFCLSCIIKTFECGGYESWSEQCPLCEMMILGRPMPDAQLTAITNGLRAERGMETAAPLPDGFDGFNPFNKYQV